MLGGADNPNGELLSYIIGADTGNTYLVPAFVHLKAKARHLHRQGANGFRCRVHIQAEAAAKSL